MSGLVYQNYNNRCKGWVNPSDLYFGPEITSLSSYYSPAGSTTLISVNGSNFYSYSVIFFGTFNPTVYFINSNILQFYIPTTLNSGTYEIYVTNGAHISNSVTYIIDNASGYWLKNANGSITNTNNSTVLISSLSRGTPITINDTAYTVNGNDNWLICDNSSQITLTLPIASMYPGREINIKTINGPVVSSETNIVPMTSSTSGITILPGIPGSWTTLVSDGNYEWIAMKN